jgi:mRNA interferase MazF
MTSAPPPTTTPRRGEVWFADLSPTLGREQAGRRPVLIISDDAYNAGPAGLTIALPLTSSVQRLATRVLLNPPEAGLKVKSDILCDQIRALSNLRLLRRWGNVTPATLALVERSLRTVLHL